MHKIVLNALKENQRGTIVELRGGESFQARMMSLGIYPGREVVKLSSFAMRGPVTIKIGRTVLALGHSMAGKIFVHTT